MKVKIGMKAINAVDSINLAFRDVKKNLQLVLLSL